MKNNLNNYNNQNNESIDNEPTVDNCSFSLSRGTSDPLLVITVSLRVGKKHRATIVSGLTCLWCSRATDIMIEIQRTKHYERKMWSNRVEYNTAAGVYCTTNDVKVPFCIPEFSGSKIVNHRFHVDNDEDESDIGYYMIIGYDVMVQLGLMANYKCQVLQSDCTTVHIKEYSILLGKSDLTKCDMREVVMQTAKPVSAREATETMVKIFDNTYAKADLEQVVNSSHLNAK